MKEHDKGETKRMQENSPKGWALDTVSGYQGKKEKKIKGHGEEKVVETLALGSCPVGISRSPKIPIVFLYHGKCSLF